MTTYTDEERTTLRTAAFGAVFLVSHAEPGMFDAVKESFAGSKAFAAASPELRDLLKSGGIPKIPGGSPTDIESGVLKAVTDSTAILETKGQSELDGFRTVVTSAMESAAAAADDVSPREVAAISKVKTALGV